jgi:GNAT superfamily N-acetyltransferase
MDRTGETDDLEIRDLRSLPRDMRHSLCRRFFDEVYVAAFPASEQTEDPGIWLPLLDAARPELPLPKLHMLIARDSAEHILGGFVFEFFSSAGAGLGTYLVVAPPFRRRGLAERLVASATDILGSDAREAGLSERPLLFAETNDPARVSRDRMQEARSTVSALRRLGFVRLEIPYVQPSLGPGRPPSRTLMLLVHEPSAGAHAAGVPADRLRAFLEAFYRALNVPAPADDPEYRATWDAIARGPLVAVSALT